MGLVYGSLNQLKQGISFINELDEHLTNVRIVSGATAEETANLAHEYNSLAKELGTTTQEVARGSLEFIRQGKSQAETAELIRVSTMQAKLANMDAAQSTEYLTSIMNGFNLESGDMIGVLDKLVQLDNNYATSVAEIAKALQRSSVSARLAGISLEELASMVTVVSSVSRQSAESIGESFKTIFARMQAVKIGADTDEEGENISNVEQVLTKYNITLRDSVGEFKDLSDVLDDVAGRWKEFGSVAKSEIASTIAGVRQRERLLILLENYDKVKQAEIMTTNAAGLAQDRYGIYLESVEAKQQKFKATWEELWLNTLNSGVTKTILDIGTGLLQLGANLGGLIPVLTTIIGLVIALNATSIASGITALGTRIAELAAKLTLAGTAAGGLAGALAPIGIILAVAGTAYGIYNAVTEAHRKKVEEATTAVDAYITRVENIPSKLADAGNAVDEITKLFAKFKEGSLTTDDEGALYDQYAILHQLIPEYEGWHYGKMGWYLEEAIAIETVNDLLREQGKLTGEEEASFKITISEKIKEYEKLTQAIKVAQAAEQLPSLIKGIVESGAKQGQTANQALLGWLYNISGTADEVLTETQKTLRDALFNYEDWLTDGEDVLSILLQDFAISEGDAEKAIEDSEKVAKEFASELFSTWVSAGAEFRQELINEFGKDNPLIKALNAMLEGETNAPKANALADQFKSFESLVASLASSLQGEAKEAFESFGQRIVDLNKNFEDGKISVGAYFDTLSEITANRDIINMFDDSTDSAQRFFTTLFTNGLVALDSLNSEFESGDIAITDYIDGLVGATEMIENQYNAIIENKDALGLSDEQVRALTESHASYSVALQQSTQDLVNMSDTADLLRQGYDSVMSGDMFSQFQTGAESALAYYKSLSEAAWNYSQQSGLAFTDSAGKALTSAEAIYGYLTGGVGNFSNFATQMTARVNESVANQNKAIQSAMTSLASVISSFKMSFTAKVDGFSTINWPLPKFFGQIFKVDSFPIQVPNISMSGGATIGTEELSNLGNNLSTIFNPQSMTPPNFGNDIWSGGGGYKPPTQPDGGGGGGGGKTPEQEAAEAEAKARSEAEKSYQDLLKMTVAMLKDRAKRAKDALKEELDAYKKLIKAKKEELDIQKKQRSDTKEISKRTNTIVNLEAELAQIQFDTSQEGIARRLALEEQLADAKTELEDEQFDQRIQAQEDALDIELELFTENINSKLDALDKYLEEEGLIVQEAQALIHDRTKEFYDELMEWNMTYGSGISTDVVDAWKGAIAWIETFGMQGATAVQNFASSAGSAISGMASNAGNAIDSLTTKTAHAISQAMTLAQALAHVADLNALGADIVLTMGGGGRNIPALMYHSGGIVGELPQIPEQEVFAKLLKGEVVTTKEQAHNFIKNTLPSLVDNGRKQTGDIKVDITIPVSGNLDHSVLPDLERAVSKAIMSIRDNAGLRSSSNFNTI
jgi:TP901 family phage tail tape measure protein